MYNERQLISAFSSNSNQRIERIWVDVGKQFVRAWRAFFTRLGHLHNLDRKNPYHLWLLHSLFLQEIDDDCATFRETWNNHPIGKEGRSKSPHVSIFASSVRQSQLTHTDETA